MINNINDFSLRRPHMDFAYLTKKSTVLMSIAERRGRG
jgi:hypothetical protein